MATAEAEAAEAAWDRYRRCLSMGATPEQREFAMAVYSRALDRQLAAEKPEKEKER